jgi:membrane protease YdiL (CAAX protease family)
MSAIPPTSKDHAFCTAADVANPPVATLLTPRHRLLALGLVLFVSFGHFILSSTYSLMRATGPADSQQRAARLVAALIAEVGSLAVLWYVLSAQGRSWKNIGWNFEWMDVPRAIGLVFGSTLATYFVWIPVQIAYRSYFGHYLVRKSMHGYFGFGISALSIAFLCLNPFFEELIVRGYLMSETIDLSGSGVLAVLVSIALQTSYHLYQGFANAFVVTIIFAVFSVYFWKTRRIAPVILAHLCVDAYALARGSF